MNTILRKQFLAHVGQTSPEPMMIEVARAEGVFFYTPEGKHYYDLVAGVSVSNVGHANPRVVEAVQRQAADYMHIMVYGEMIERPQVRYAARIAELAARYIGWIIVIPLASAMPFIMDGIMVGATQTRVMRNSMLLSTVAYFGIFYSLYPVIGNNALWLAFTLYMFLRGTLQLLMTRRLRLIYRKAAA